MPDKKKPAMSPTGGSVDAFLASVADEGRRGDAERLCALMLDITGEPATLWGSGIIGFGRYHYRYDSGHEGDSALVSFAPRKEHLVLYLASGFESRYPDALSRLGPHKTGKGCLYLKRLADVDEDALRALIDRSVRVHRGVDRASS